MDNVEEEAEEMSTSGVSTVNSTKLKVKPQQHESKYITEEVAALKVENFRLLQDLLESHKMYQILLKSTIEEQGLNLQMLQNFTSQLTQMSSASRAYERSVSTG